MAFGWLLSGEGRKNLIFPIQVLEPIERRLSDYILESGIENFYKDHVTYAVCVYERVASYLFSTERPFDKCWLDQMDLDSIYLPLEWHSEVNSNLSIH